MLLLSQQRRHTRQWSRFTEFLIWLVKSVSCHQLSFHFWTFIHHWNVNSNIKKKVESSIKLWAFRKKSNRKNKNKHPWCFVAANLQTNIIGSLYLHPFHYIHLVCLFVQIVICRWWCLSKEQRFFVNWKYPKKHATKSLK